MKGEVVWFYAFDVANEIRTNQIAELLTQKPTPFAVRRDHTIPRDVPFHQPLSVEPAMDLAIEGHRARLEVRIYEVGVVSIAIRAPCDKDCLADLTRFHLPRLPDGRTLDEFAKSLCDRVRQEIAGTLRHPSPPSEPEAYTAFCLTDLGASIDAKQWLLDHRAQIAGLLTDLPPERLSEEQIAETLRHQRTYEKSDLVVIDWDAALVIDQTGYLDDVLYVLELANLQLEELKTLDHLLDKYLNRAYDQLEQRPRWFLGRSHAVLGELRWLRIDLTRLADEVTNITKFIGDWYLARVYLSARERFHLDGWRAGVEKRLGQLDEIFSVLQADITERRMFWLEIIIVVFFAIDIALALWWK